MNRIAVPLLLVAALALASCTSSSSDSPSASATAPSTVGAVTASAHTEEATPSPTPSASPTPVATTPAAAQGDPCKDPSVSSVGLAGIGFDRYARICVGMSFAQASEAMPGPEITGDALCPWYATVLAIDDPGLYVGAVTQPDNPGAAIWMFRMTWVGDPADAGAFDAPATVEGVTVGSTVAEVTAAFPKASAIVVNDPSRGARNQLVAAGPDGTSIVFDVTEGVVTDIYWGQGLAQGSAGELCAI
jgi:hypothetical protein